MINFDIKLGGEYKLVITKPDGTKQETGWFSNLILNQGLDRIGTSSNQIISYAQVGTGNVAPAITQIGLNSFLAGSSQFTGVPVTNSGAPTYISNHVWNFPFAQGAVVGNITEIGVGWAPTGNNLFSRALILDNLGSPTSITLVAIDQLTVYYRLKVVPPLTDVSSTVTIGGTPYNYTARVSSVGSFVFSSYTFWASQIGQAGSMVYPYTAGTAGQTYGAGSVLGTITGTPTVQSGTGGSVTPGTYTPGTYTRDDTFNWSITQGNATGGIQAIVFYFAPQGGVSFQYRFTTVIPKDNTKTLSITTRITWTRI